MTCTHLKELLEIEIPSLRKEILKDKYYLSQEEGHDVGWARAERHYIDTHLEGWAKGFKDCYCSKVCTEVNCEYHKRNKIRGDK
jgi:hypothetical protein